MKKILLTVGLFGLVAVGKAQTVLNELYTLPNTGKHEFIELYNSSVIATQSVDCFTILTYWKNSTTDRGWYVMDLPDLTVDAKDFFVLAAADPFNTQNLVNVVPDFNWNDPNFRNGNTGGSLKKYSFNGTGYDDISNTIPANFNDFLFGGNGNNYYVLVFVNGQFSNGFIGGSNSGLLPAEISGLPDLNVVMNGCANFPIDFSALGAMESVVSQPGTDNGYARTSDGKCGAWVKTSASVQHTPGLTNGSASGLSGAIETAVELLQCNVGPGYSVVNFDITGVTGDASEGADFPVEVQLYYDFGTLGQLDGADIYQRSKFQNTIADPADTFRIAQTQYVILVYKTQRGCFDKVAAIVNGCSPLPVEFASFSATRNRTMVNLKWETSFEQENSGFAIERNVGGVWTEIAFVPSLATDGNSSDMLAYTYADPNNIKGITQYRLRQVDFDGRSKFSAIRAVRGEGQLANTVVYPNPTSDGKVTVVFEDGNSHRDVSLIDMSGRVIRQWKGVTNNNIQIDNLNPGVFSLRIVIPATGEQAVEKIVVNKR